MSSLRRHFLKSLLLSCLLTLSYPGRTQVAPESFTIIHITDTHVCTLDGRDPVFVEVRKHNEDGGQLLRTFLLRVPLEVQADAVAITGDLIDFYATEPRPNEVREGQIERFAEAVMDCPVPLWLTLGNHDVGNLTIDPATGKFQVSRHDAHKARAAWIRTMACFRDGTFYSIVRAVGKTKYRLIFLDNDYPLNTREANYYADRFQIDWLSRQLQQAKGERVVLFTHLPLPVTEQGADQTERTGPCGWSSLPQIHRERFLSVLDENPVVVAVFAGHRHANVVEEITLPSGRKITQVQTGYFQAGPDNWRVVKLTADSVEVSVAGGSKPEKTIGIVSR